MCIKTVARQLNIHINTQTIYKKIVHIQKKLYIAAKKCDLTKLNKLVNYFFLSKEYRIIIVKQIIGTIEKENPISNYCRKITQLMYLSIAKYIIEHGNIVYFLSHKVDQYIIYLFLYSKHQAVFETNLMQNKLPEMYRLRKRTIEMLSNQSIYLAEYNLQQIIPNLKGKKILITRLSSIQEVQTKICYWLSNVDVYFHKQKEKQQASNCLYTLLTKILYTGLRWAIYLNIKNTYFYKEFLPFDQTENLIFLTSRTLILQVEHILGNFTKNVGFHLNSVYQICYCTKKLITINHKKISVDFIEHDILGNKNQEKILIFSSIRHLLYYRNHQNRWRLYKKLDPNKVKYFIIRTLQKKSLQSKAFLSKNKINTKIDNIFYGWQMKK